MVLGDDAGRLRCAPAYLVGDGFILRLPMGVLRWDSGGVRVGAVTSMRWGSQKASMR